jgi:neprilysin
LNYGAIGSVIGHEITHGEFSNVCSFNSRAKQRWLILFEGFDDEGSQFDSNGNLVDWWEQDTKKAYLEKARCIIEQYANYTEPTVGLELNGINTQGENIADNGGIKEAYLAYRKFVEQNGEELPLPGLNMTSNQLFWISAAQTWCAVTRPGEHFHSSQQQIFLIYSSRKIKASNHSRRALSGDVPSQRPCQQHERIFRGLSVLGRL